VSEVATSVEECVPNVTELYADSSRTWNMCDRCVTFV